MAYCTSTARRLVQSSKEGQKGQYARHKEARKLFHEIDLNPQNYLIIHYSCESFYDIKDGHTPRITSIAVSNYATAQTESFSIHKMAEKLHVPLPETESCYDELEKSMLNEFFNYAQCHKEFYWIHWNMRDMNYGFKAIEHRYSVLGGEPYEIPDDKKIDLSRQLIACYGVNYTEHPRMEKLLAQNDIKAKDYLTGQQEAKAFDEHQYVKLHMSTLRKVDVFSDILQRTINHTLKVHSSWKDIYGLSIQGFINFCQETWWAQILWTIVSMIIGAFISEWVGRLL